MGREAAIEPTVVERQLRAVIDASVSLVAASIAAPPLVHLEPTLTAGILLVSSE